MSLVPGLHSPLPEHLDSEAPRPLRHRKGPGPCEHLRQVAAIEHEGTATGVAVTDRFVAEGEKAQAPTVTWSCAEGEQWLLRGSGIEVFRDGTKTLELTWHSTAPLSVTWHDPVGPPPGGLPNPAFAHGCVEITVLDSAATAESANPAETTDTADAAVMTDDRTPDVAEIRTEIRSRDFLYQDWGLTPEATGWRRFLGEVPVNYYVDPVPGAEHAVVVFSALGPKGSFTYNYKRSLDALPAHKIYVLDDFGDQGAYFHSHHRYLGIHRSVLAALQAALLDLGTPPEHTHAVGSSKGGTAALMFAAELGAATVIAGAPQIKIGSFLSSPHPNILKFMTGGTSQEDIAWADGILRPYIARLGDSTQVTVVIGDKDHHFRDHLPVLQDMVHGTGAPAPRVVTLPGIDHAGIGTPFRQLMPQLLRNAIGVSDVSTYELEGWQFITSVTGGQVELQMVSPANPRTPAAVYLVQDGNAAHKVPYSPDSRTLTFALAAGRQSRFRFFVKEGDSRQTLSTPPLTGAP